MRKHTYFWTSIERYFLLYVFDKRKNKNIRQRITKPNKHLNLQKNRVNQEMDNIQREHCEIFNKHMEHDLYGSKKKVWEMIRKQRKDMNKFIRIEDITKEQ